MKKTEKAAPKPKAKAGAKPKARTPAPRRKNPAKRAAATAAAPKKGSTPISKITPEQQIVGAVFLGKILDYYAKLGVVTLTLEAPLALGDTIRIKGHTTDLTQKVESLQVSHQCVQSASAGEGVGIRVADRSRRGDAVYKL